MNLLELSIALGVPIATSILSTLWLVQTKITKMETDIRYLKEVNDERFCRIDKHVHDIRNSLQSLVIAITKLEAKNEEH